MKILLVLTLSGSVLALLLLGLRYVALRRMPSTVYYYAWLLVLLRFALPLPGLIPTTVETRTADAPVYSEATIQDYYEQIPVFPQNAVPVGAPAASAESQISVQAAEMPETQTSVSTPKTTHSMDWRSPKLWLSVWAIGAALSLGLTVLAYLRFTIRLRHELHRPDRFTRELYASIPGRKSALFRSDAIRTPLMFGVFSPKIVVPEREYDEELLLNILRHELMHYRRYDTLYKWVASAILSLHWFNPVAWVIRREVNRSCELSCDEMLLRSMDKDEKQSYGNSLLLMAAQSPLPSAVVATSFATEKRNLKERLVQIMNYKKSGTRLLSTIIAVVLLTGCAVGAGPISGKDSEEAAGGPDSVESTEAETSEKAPEPPVAPPRSEDGVVKVTNIDEFLVSIAPHTTIELAEGDYDLTKAFDYGKSTQSEYYSWNGTVSDDGDGAELVIKDVKDLTIRGAGIGKTSILAVDRSSSVINFSGCKNLNVSNITAGHTVEPDPCNGSVLCLENCPDTNVDSCGLYGCGTIGVDVRCSERINVTNCDIYECSVSAVRALDSEDVFISSCAIHDHGTRTPNSLAYNLFDVLRSKGFTVYNCKIHDNRIQGLLYANETERIFFISNEVTNNKINESAFYFDQLGAVVDGCHFENNSIDGWYLKDAKFPAIDLNGNKISADQFTAMKFRDIKPETVNQRTDVIPTKKAKNVAPGAEVTVKTVDEFLEAIGPDRTIVLDGTNFDLSKAKNYGDIGTAYYRWEEVPDGFALVIHDADKLTIKAKNTDPASTTLEALPRYANVLTFKDCYQVTVEGFTAGHTKEKGACAGGVLYFDDCESIKVEKMRLYGCGDMGIDTYMCTDIDVINTEIYECTSGGCYLLCTKGITFKDCNIHDVPTPALWFSECKNITWNGKKLTGEELRYNVNADGSLVDAPDT